MFGSESIAYCPQSPFIQTKTVKENIAFYEPLDDELLKNSVRMAALESDLKLFDKGLDSMLGEGGTNISGGQRTRINLARCFYKPKDIYLLDDPLSSLDFHVACEIIENAIQKDLKNKTRVIVTHSIQYLMYADKIIYLDEGQVKFDGNYDTFKSTELYSDLKKTIEKEENQDEEEEKTKRKSTTEYESHVSMGTTEQLSRRKGSFEISESLEGGRKRSTSHEKKLISESDRINNNLNNFNNQLMTQDIFKKKSDMDDEHNQDLKNLQDSWKRADKGPSSIQEDSDDVESIRIRQDTMRTHKEDEDEEQPLEAQQTIETITEVNTKDELNKKALQNLVKDEKKAKKIEKYFLKEDKAEGRRLIMTAKLFLNYTGGFVLYLLILLICVINAFMDYFCLNYLYDFILNFEEEKKHLSSSLLYLYAIFLGPVILVIIRTAIITICSVKTSRNIHHKMTIKTIYGDLLGFHDRVETARLINRFSTDTDEMDKSIPYRVSVFMLYTGFLISDVIVGIITIGWWVLIAYGIYYIIMFYYQNLYVKFKKDLYRLESVTRSPIVNVTNEILEGKMILKVFKKEKAIMDELVNHLEENSKNLTIQNALTNWFSLRVSLFNVIVVQLICFIFIFCALYFDFITIKKVILFMPFVLNFIWNIDFWINIFSQLETSLISLERCQAFEDIPSEKNYLNIKQIFKRMTGSELANKTHLDFVKTFKPLSYVEELLPGDKGNIDLRDDDEYAQVNQLDNNSCIFDKGRISFNKVDAKYPTKEELTLKDFSFEVRAGEKIGIVGQTGSGKSTIIKLLSQYLSHSKGDIIVDGYDIKKLDLQILRHQYLLLSQEVALFDGTIKENIDIEEIVNRTQVGEKKTKKQDQYETLNSTVSLNMSKLQISDDEIVDNMISFGFSKEKLESDGLNFKIENNGGNLSQGEQQLVALMKALYTQKNIIILDEATSNIDYQSEKKIMDFFYDKIVNKTLITVAHRINTVLRCDRIIVLDQGQIVETGKTKDLLQDESSRFYQLYKKLTENMEQE
jgi:ABC-type multidrug transport system fused ATPase/permease subunit